ncbi:hypothetical protein DIPPA_33624 [Diplonema papillatum]|nr:hypothetical protein DIPPA_33624 [Diplonema papillatum]
MPFAIEPSERDLYSGPAKPGHFVKSVNRREAALSRVSDLCERWRDHPAQRDGEEAGLELREALASLCIATRGVEDAQRRGAAAGPAAAGSWQGGLYADKMRGDTAFLRDPEVAGLVALARQPAGEDSGQTVRHATSKAGMAALSKREDQLGSDGALDGAVSGLSNSTEAGTPVETLRVAEARAKGREAPGRRPQQRPSSASEAATLARRQLAALIGIAENGSTTPVAPARPASAGVRQSVPRQPTPAPSSEQAWGSPTSSSSGSRHALSAPVFECFGCLRADPAVQKIRAFCARVSPEGLAVIGPGVTRSTSTGHPARRLDKRDLPAYALLEHLFRTPCDARTDAIPLVPNVELTAPLAAMDPQKAISVSAADFGAARGGGCASAGALYGDASFVVPVSRLAEFEASTRLGVCAAALPAVCAKELCELSTAKGCRMFLRVFRDVPVSRLGDADEWEGMRDRLVDARNRSQDELARLLAERPTGAERECGNWAQKDDAVRAAERRLHDVMEQLQYVEDGICDKLRGDSVRTAKAQRRRDHGNPSYQPLFNAAAAVQSFVDKLRRRPTVLGFRTTSSLTAVLKSTPEELSRQLYVMQHGVLTGDGLHGKTGQLCRPPRTPIVFVAANYAHDKGTKRKFGCGNGELLAAVVEGCLREGVDHLCVPWPVGLGAGGVETLVGAAGSAVEQCRGGGSVAVASFTILLNLCEMPDGELKKARKCLERISAASSLLRVILHDRSSKYLAAALSTEATSCALLVPSTLNSILLGLRGNAWEATGDPSFTLEEDLACHSTFLLSHASITSAYSNLLKYTPHHPPWQYLEANPSVDKSSRKLPSGEPWNTDCAENGQATEREVPPETQFDCPAEDETRAAPWGISRPGEDAATMAAEARRELLSLLKEEQCSSNERLAHLEALARQEEQRVHGEHSGMCVESERTRRESLALEEKESNVGELGTCVESERMRRGSLALEEKEDNVGVQLGTCVESERTRRESVVTEEGLQRSRPGSAERFDRCLRNVEETAVRVLAAWEAAERSCVADAEGSEWKRCVKAALQGKRAVKMHAGLSTGVAGKADMERLVYRETGERAAITCARDRWLQATSALEAEARRVSPVDHAADTIQTPADPFLCENDTRSGSTTAEQSLAGQLAKNGENGDAPSRIPLAKPPPEGQARETGGSDSAELRPGNRENSAAISSGRAAAEPASGGTKSSRPTIAERRAKRPGSAPAKPAGTTGNFSFNTACAVHLTREESATRQNLCSASKCLAESPLDGALTSSSTALRTAPGAANPRGLQAQEQAAPGLATGNLGLDGMLAMRPASAGSIRPASGEPGAARVGANSCEANAPGRREALGPLERIGSDEPPAPVPLPAWSKPLPDLRDQEDFTRRGEGLQESKPARRPQLERMGSDEPTLPEDHFRPLHVLQGRETDARADCERVAVLTLCHLRLDGLKALRTARESAPEEPSPRSDPQKETPATGPDPDRRAACQLPLKEPKLDRDTAPGPQFESEPHPPDSGGRGQSSSHPTVQEQEHGAPVGNERGAAEPRKPKSDRDTAPPDPQFESEPHPDSAGRAQSSPFPTVQEQEHGTRVDGTRSFTEQATESESNRDTASDPQPEGDPHPDSVGRAQLASLHTMQEQEHDARLDSEQEALLKLCHLRLDGMQELKAAVQSSIRVADHILRAAAGPEEARSPEFARDAAGNHGETDSVGRARGTPDGGTTESPTRPNDPSRQLQGRTTGVGNRQSSEEEERKEDASQTKEAAGKSNGDRDTPPGRSAAPGSAGGNRVSDGVAAKGSLLEKGAGGSLPPSATGEQGRGDRGGAPRARGPGVAARVSQLEGSADGTPHDGGGMHGGGGRPPGRALSPGVAERIARLEGAAETGDSDRNRAPARDRLAGPGVDRVAEGERKALSPGVAERLSQLEGGAETRESDGNWAPALDRLAGPGLDRVAEGERKALSPGVAERLSQLEGGAETRESDGSWAPARDRLAGRGLDRVAEDERKALSSGVAERLPQPDSDGNRAPVRDRLAGPGVDGVVEDERKARGLGVAEEGASRLALRRDGVQVEERVGRCCVAGRERAGRRRKLRDGVVEREGIARRWCEVKQGEGFAVVERQRAIHFIVDEALREITWSRTEARLSGLERNTRRAIETEGAVGSLSLHLCLRACSIDDDAPPPPSFPRRYSMPNLCTESRGSASDTDQSPLGRLSLDLLRDVNLERSAGEFSFSGATHGPALRTSDSASLRKPHAVADASNPHPDGRSRAGAPPGAALEGGDEPLQAVREESGGPGRTESREEADGDAPSRTGAALEGGDNPLQAEPGAAGVREERVGPGRTHSREEADGPRGGKPPLREESGSGSPSRRSPVATEPVQPGLAHPRSCESAQSTPRRPSSEGTDADLSTSEVESIANRGLNGALSERQRASQLPHQQRGSPVERRKLLDLSVSILQRAWRVCKARRVLGHLREQDLEDMETEVRAYEFYETAMAKISSLILDYVSRKRLQIRRRQQAFYDELADGFERDLFAGVSDEMELEITDSGGPGGGGSSSAAERTVPADEGKTSPETAPPESETGRGDGGEGAAG